MSAFRLGRALCPLWVKKQTCAAHTPMSALGHKRTYASSLHLSSAAYTVANTMLYVSNMPSDNNAGAIPSPA